MKKLLFAALLILVMTFGCIQYIQSPNATNPNATNPNAPTAYIDSISPGNASVGQMVSFTGHGTDPDGTVVGYKWHSSIDGDLNPKASFEISSLSKGMHTITFIVQDNNGNWSTEVTDSISVSEAAATTLPMIKAFNASPGIITSGGSSTVSWEVSDASTISIDQGIGTVALSGTRVVYPGSTTTYILTATNASGSITATTQVAVETSSIPIPTPVSDEPDLVITDIIQSGSTISYIIKNQGTATASPSTSQLVIDGVIKASDAVGPLSVGASSTESFSYSYTCSSVSDAVAVQADKNNVVDESNEGNNAYSETWSCIIKSLDPIFQLNPAVLKPDLIITDIYTVPPPMGATIKYIIKNQGLATAGASNTILYVGGFPVATAHVGSLAAGTSYTGTFTGYTFTCPSGTKTVVARADMDDVVDEGTMEGNNGHSETWTCP